MELTEWIPAQALSAPPPAGCFGAWPGLVALDEGSLRAQCSEAPAQGGPAHTLGQQQGRGLGYTCSPLHPPCPMGPPHHTWLFPFGKGMSLPMLSLSRWCRIWYLPKPGMAESYWSYYLCLHSMTPDTSRWSIILQVRTPHNNSCLYCGICWHVWGLAPGLHRKCSPRTVWEKGDCF